MLRDVYRRDVQAAVARADEFDRQFALVVKQQEEAFGNKLAETTQELEVLINECSLVARLLCCFRVSSTPDESSLPTD
jgi:hypothetical protein